MSRDLSKPWIEDDAYFKEQLVLGRHFEQHVASRLRANGVEDVVVLNDGFRNSTTEIEHFTRTSGDLKIKGWPFEVKSRSETFHCPSDWHRWPMFVDTVSSFDQKAVKPGAYIFVSQTTGKLIAVDSKTRPQWTTVNAFDKKRQIRDTFYCVYLGLVLDEETLFKRLKAMRAR